MSKVKAPFSIQLKIAFKGLRVFFSHTSSVAAFILLSIFGLALINALFDYELLWTLITLDAPLNFRLEAIRDVLFDPSGLPLPNMIATIIMAVLFGYVLSASLFVALKQREKSSKSGGVGIVFGIISGGCAACGTSILAPLLTAIGITTTSAALSFALVMNIVGILLLLFSAFKISIIVASNNS